MSKKYKEIDGYKRFFEYFFDDNKNDNLIEEIWKFTKNNMYMIDHKKKKVEAWESLNFRIDKRLKKSEKYIKDNNISKVYVRTFGDKGKENTKALLISFYEYIFDYSEKEVISIDRSNNSAPSSTLNRYTEYTKTKNHKSKNILFNYQVSHIFGKTLNCYAFTAPWNIVYLPKILDPFTGHESNGKLTEQFTQKLQEFAKLNYKEQIEQFNKRMEELAPKINKFKAKLKSENEFDEQSIKRFFKSLDENFSQIDL